MNVMVNGAATEVAAGSTIADVLVALGRGSSPRGVAVAINGAVVRKAEWSETRLSDEDRVEVLTAVGGG